MSELESVALISSKTPQSGIFLEGFQHMYFLEYQLSSEDDSLVKRAIAQSLIADKVEVVVSFGHAAWQRLQPCWTPATLAPFTTINGEQGHRAPSTQTDVFFWLQGHDIGDVFDQAVQIQVAMQPVAKLMLEERGFDYHHEMDLIGFEDGSANPKTDQLKHNAAVIPKGQLGEGGSLVLSQKWVHNLPKWNQVSVHAQEKVVGRTKDENIELEGAAMPDDSHISRTDLNVDGVAMKIYRRSAPFGGVKKNGLLFLAFGCELIRFSSQLESMYGLTEDKKIDQLLNYSTAVSGSYWFAPALEDLAEILQ